MTASICVLVHPWWPMTASDSELSTKISNTYVNFCSDQQQTLSYNLPISSPTHLLSTLKLGKEVSGERIASTRVYGEDKVLWGR